MPVLSIRRACVILAATLCLQACGASSGAPVTTPAAALTVEVVQPTRETWPDTVRADGTLSAWQEAVIAAETGSLKITDVLVDIGSRVKRGQLLASLADDTPQADLRKQEAAVQEAEANLRQAEADVARSQLAAQSGALSGQKIDQYLITAATDRASLASARAELKSKRIALAHTRITAVDDGVISSRSALLGNVVSSGAELFRLIRQGRVEWQAEVDALDLARIHPGDKAQLSLPGGATVEGQVRLVAPTLSTSTARAIVYVSLPGRDDIRAGVFASGTIEVAATPALSLPESALVPRDGRSDVYVLDAQGTTVRRCTVITGRRRQDRVEILSGLPDSARVVASGGAFLSDGATVKLASPAAEVGGQP